MVSGRHKLNFEFSDRLLEAPREGQPGETALANTKRAYTEAFNSVPLDWTERRSRIVVPSLKTLACLALMPSLEKLALDKPHDISVAEQVVANLGVLNNQVMAAERLRPPVVNTRRNVKGAVSELAILGTLWSMIKHGSLLPDCYVLPTLWREDWGGRRHEGYKVGADFVLMRDSDMSVERWIQAKTTDRAQNNGDYYPGTVMLSVSHMLQDESGAEYTDELLRMVANDDTQLLKIVSRQVKLRFGEAEQRERRFQEAGGSLIQ